MKQKLKCKKHPLRFAMAMERNLITVPCENEVRPEKEDALDWTIGGSRTREDGLKEAQYGDTFYLCTIIF